jgi:hypothetical protein
MNTLLLFTGDGAAQPLTIHDLLMALLVIAIIVCVFTFFFFVVPILINKITNYDWKKLFITIKNK